MTLLLFFVQRDHTSPSLPLFRRFLYRKPTEKDYLEEDFSQKQQKGDFFSDKTAGEGMTYFILILG